MPLKVWLFSGMCAIISAIPENRIKKEEKALNKMLGYLKGYKRESVLAPLFKMLEATFDLFVPLVMADRKSVV